jgi:hypothetical protein
MPDQRSERQQKPSEGHSRRRQERGRNTRENRMKRHSDSCDMSARQCSAAATGARLPSLTADGRPQARARDTIRVRMILPLRRCELSGCHRRFPVREMERFQLKQRLCGAIEAAADSEF